MFNYRDLFEKKEGDTLKFSEFVGLLLDNPEKILVTSAQLIYAAIRHFGFRIVIRSGEPVISYNVFQDPFSNGLNAVFGQEFAIKELLEVVEAMSSETGPTRGLVLAGPPASGKTNIVDLISLALEEYTKEPEHQIYTFEFRIPDSSGIQKIVQAPLLHNPVLLFPLILGNTSPRQGLLQRIVEQHPKFVVPSYFRTAALDCFSLNLLNKLASESGEGILTAIETNIVVKRVSVSASRGVGIANVDNMRRLGAEIIYAGNHIPDITGAIAKANRGLLHLHDAFGNGESDIGLYKPLLMLLGSGKMSIDTTHTAIDTVSITTTNYDELACLKEALGSGRLLDRINIVRADYLQDYLSEEAILKRDLETMHEKHDLDPNLARVAAIFNVLTRITSNSFRTTYPLKWLPEQVCFYMDMLPEQKLILLAHRPEDPMTALRELSQWHPFRNEAQRLGLDLRDENSIRPLISTFDEPELTISGSGLFSQKQQKLLNADFMNALRVDSSHDQAFGISVRQAQNLLRSAIAASDGKCVHVEALLSYIGKAVQVGTISFKQDPRVSRVGSRIRRIGGLAIERREGQYQDLKSILNITRGLYYIIIRSEIVRALVNRDPEAIEADLRKYIQHCLLYVASQNATFSRMMTAKYVYVDPATGHKVDWYNDDFMKSIELIIADGVESAAVRRNIADVYFESQAQGAIAIEAGRGPINSKDDRLTDVFSRQFNLMLSHLRSRDGLHVEGLEHAFHFRRFLKARYVACDERLRTIVERSLTNMASYGYSEEVALHTILLALRSGIVDLNKVFV